MEFSREALFKQALDGDACKVSDDMAIFNEKADSQMGFIWEPGKIVASALDGSSMLPSLSACGLGSQSLPPGGLPRSFP